MMTSISVNILPNANVANGGDKNTYTSWGIRSSTLLVTSPPMLLILRKEGTMAKKLAKRMQRDAMTGKLCAI